MVRKPTAKEFEKMCRNKTGNITNIAAGFNVSRMTVYKWMETKKYKEAFDDVRESLLDFNESQQLRLIRGVEEKDDEGNFIGWKEKPDVSIMIWFDKTRGKHRGYTEKAEVDHTNAGEKFEAQPLLFVSADKLTDKQIQDYISQNIENKDPK